MNEPLINFRFAEIQIISKSLSQPPINGIKGNVSFDIKYEIKVQAENKIVIGFVTIGVREEEKKTEYLANFNLAYIFEIIDFSNVIKLTQENLYHVPQQLEDTIKQVGISTSRGVVFSELRGTYLHNYIMPVIDIQAFNTSNSKKEETNKSTNT